MIHPHCPEPLAGSRSIRHSSSLLIPARLARAVAVFLMAVSVSGCANVEQSELPLQTAQGSASSEPGTFQVLFETTKGNFTVEVHPDWSPNGAKHFRELVEDGFYNDCGFFRVVPNFMVQFGLAGDPAMTEKWKDSIMDDRVVKSNKRGYMTYAKTGAPNSRSTQVFINFKDNTFLDEQGFSPFGIVLGDGMTVVDEINNEYGEPPGAAQERITLTGNAYLKAKMPNVDYITKATIVTPAAE